MIFKFLKRKKEKELIVRLLSNSNAIYSVK